MRKFLILLACGLCGIVFAASAQINRSVDEKGRVVYSDQPAAGNVKGGKPVLSSPASGQAPQKKGVPLAVQPTYPVYGDPLIAKMRENEERRVRERVTEECWRQKTADCTDEWAIKRMVDEDVKARVAKEPKPKPVVREPLPPDFCKRNPRVEACTTSVVVPDIAVPEKPAPKK